MLELDETRLEVESAGVAQVCCSHCDARLGRVQISAPDETDPREWEEKVQGEIDVLHDEHRKDCPAVQE